jgi:hypothetical protein
MNPNSDFKQRYEGTQVGADGRRVAVEPEKPVKKAAKSSAKSSKKDDKKDD